jgi:hypothetical protein
LWDEASTYGDVVYEYNNSGTALANYVLGGTGIISQTRGTTTSYFLQDGQGSTRALTNSSTGACAGYLTHPPVYWSYRTKISSADSSFPSRPDRVYFSKNTQTSSERFFGQMHHS